MLTPDSSLPIFRCCGLLLTIILFSCVSAFSASLADLDPHADWHVRDLTITGNQQISTNDLKEQLLTKTRPWYALWRPFPEFDINTFARDLERLQRYYRAQGYYETAITYHLEVDSHAVTPHITIIESEPIRVIRLTAQLTDQPELEPAMQALLPSLPLQEGEIFNEERYQQTEARLKEFFLQQQRGRVQVARRAQVTLDQHAAQVEYMITAGPLTVFGPTTVEGTKEIPSSLVTRDLAYAAGDPFSGTAIEKSRKNLLSLDLFSSVRLLQDESPADSAIVPMRVEVDEKPFREWQLGVGYGTEDEFRGQVRWRHNNWFGDGRKLDFQVKASSLTRLFDVSFLQPHFLGSRNRFSFLFRPQQVDEPGYLLNLIRLQPRLDRELTDTLSGFISYRAEYDRLNNVNRATSQRLRAFDRKGALSGLSLGLLWNTTDELVNPTRGEIASFSIEQVGGFLGGDFDFYKMDGEVKRYHLVSEQTVFASRLRLGFARPFAGGKEVPLFERFFAGGATSVRGYGRHRLGPLSSADDPIGGRSVIEGSLELRRQLFEKLGGTVFLDFGQVSLHSFDVPIEDLRFSLGFGVFYTTPVGPLLLDLGFPLDPPHGDQPWQVHFSIGQFF
jgi:outer membrane protein assembly complex protein YaeT